MSFFVSVRARNSKFIIVGGGIHGAYLAISLLKQGMAALDDLIIIDPGDEPLSNWMAVTSNVGMDYLRSPKVHHLDTEPFSLKKFARNRSYTRPLFIAPNDRPSLDLFNNHAGKVLEESRIRERFYHGLVSRVSLNKNSASVSVNGETLKSQYVILSIGQGDNINWPDWALAAKQRGAPVTHVLERSFSRLRLSDTATVAVIGGGMSAVHTAISLAGKDRMILLLTPHALRQHDYDSDPGWMGPKYLTLFRRIPNPKERRSVINEARNTGSITRDLKKKLLLLEKRNQCKVYTDSIVACTHVSASITQIRLSGGDVFGVNQIVLATGYNSTRPGGEMVDQLASNYNLPCSECGYPVTDVSLRWHNQLFVTGALAELVVGPASRNIIGARMAAEKIVRYLNLDSTNI